MHMTSKIQKGRNTRVRVFQMGSSMIGVETTCIELVMVVIGLINHRILRIWIFQDMEGSYHQSKVRMNMERHLVEYLEKCMMILN